MSREKSRFDLYQTITDQIVTAIERVSAADFRLPWHRSGLSSIQPKNALTKNAYRGINIVALWVAAEVQQYPHALWASYKQWEQLGAHVRKGERSSLVCFYKKYDVEPDPEDEDDDGKRLVLRYSNVFNVAQVDGFAHPDSPAMSIVERHQTADAFFAATKADIWHGGERAFYHTREDFIQMPDERLFRGSQYGSATEDYFCVLAHEATHWTSHRTRLNRELGKRFGDHQYSAEELVAELGSAFICAELAICPQPRLDHAQYLKHWLVMMKADSRAIFTAAARAQEAVTYLKSLHQDDTPPSHSDCDRFAAPSTSRTAKPHERPTILKFEIADSPQPREPISQAPLHSVAVCCRRVAPSRARTRAIDRQRDARRRSRTPLTERLRAAAHLRLPNEASPRAVPRVLARGPHGTVK